MWFENPMTKFKLVLHGTYNPKFKKMKEGCKFVFQEKGKSTKQCTVLFLGWWCSLPMDFR